MLLRYDSFRAQAVRAIPLQLSNCDRYVTKRKHAVLWVVQEGKRRYSILDTLVGNYDNNLWNYPILIWYCFTSSVSVGAHLNYVCFLSPRQKAQGRWATRLPGISDCSPCAHWFQNSGNLLHARVKSSILVLIVPPHGVFIEHHGLLGSFSCSALYDLAWLNSSLYFTYKNKKVIQCNCLIL